MKDVNNNNRTNNRLDNTQLELNDNNNKLTTYEGNHKIPNLPKGYNGLKYSGMAISVFLFILVSIIVVQKLSAVVFVAFDILIGLSLILFSVGLGIVTILFLVSRDNSGENNIRSTTVIKNNIIGDNSIIIATNGRAHKKSKEKSNRNK